MPLASVDICTHTHTPTHRDTNIYMIKIYFKKMTSGNEYLLRKEAPMEKARNF